jgi:hypothetical protein
MRPYPELLFFADEVFKRISSVYGDPSKSV